MEICLDRAGGKCVYTIWLTIGSGWRNKTYSMWHMVIKLFSTGAYIDNHQTYWMFCLLAIGRY